MDGVRHQEILMQMLRCINVFKKKKKETDAKEASGIKYILERFFFLR